MRAGRVGAQFIPDPLPSLLKNQQEYGIDYDETFSLWLLMTIAQTVLAIVASQF